MSGEDSSAPVSKTATTIIQFVSAEDESVCGPQISIPSSTSVRQLQELLNKLLENEEPQPYSFYIDEEEITGKLPESVFSRETTVNVVYAPQATFRVRPVTRSSGTLTGHTNSVLKVQFSPRGDQLASASGDGTVRLWDLDTQTPLKTLSGHRDWVLEVAWSPDGQKVASGARNGEVKVWNAADGSSVDLVGHKEFVTSIAWEPYAALNPAEAAKAPGKRNRVVGARLATASKDSSVRIWNVPGRTCLFALSGHTQGVQCVKWGGSGHIYSGSRDRTINVYEGTTGRLLRTLRGHAHWVNCMSLSSDYITRTGPFEITGKVPDTEAAAIEASSKRYMDFVAKRTASGVTGERLVSGSDDGTLIIWKPLESPKPLVRMTGHQQQVMCVAYSPDGWYIASGSCDKSVKLWDGATGKYITTFRGHVGTVYQVSWSADSRMFVSGSKDSTMKLWDIRTKKLAEDLPGHADEVFSVDWSPDGEAVASGSFDRTLKLWRH